MVGEITGDQIQACLTGKLSILKYADRCAKEADSRARVAGHERDLAEWEALDQDSKQFLIDYLTNRTQT